MLEAYLMLDGRLRRRGYLGYSVLLWILMFIGSLLTVWAAINLPRHPTAVAIIATVVLALFVNWAHVALAAKRFHDLDKSGWFALLMVPGSSTSIAVQTVHVPFSLQVGSGIIWLLTFLYLLFARGTEGPNRFGYPPQAL